MCTFYCPQLQLSTGSVFFSLVLAILPCLQEMHEALVILPSPKLLGV